MRALYRSAALTMLDVPRPTRVLCYNRTRAMKHLWSPWRMAYIEERNTESGCLFCNRRDEAPGPVSLILHRGDRAFVILNRYPYSNGHVMVVPNAHVPSLEDLDSTTLTELMVLARRGL